MVISQKIMKKRKNAVKLLHGSKRQNVKLKSHELSKPELKQIGDRKRSIVKVSSEMKNVGNTKVLRKKLRKGVQEKSDSVKKPIDQQSARENIRELQNIQHADAQEHVDAGNAADKKNAKTEGNRAAKQLLKRKHSTINKAQDKEIPADTNEVSKTAKSQKRKRVHTPGDEENADCLNLGDLSKEHILQCISAIFHLTEEQLKNKNTLFDGESQPVFMQVTCIRVPKTPRRCMRILLPHSIVSSNDEVALFVGDLQKGRRKDYEPTVEHYEDLLRKHGCTRIKSIIPMNQVKTEYDQFELKRKLVGSYDYFLCDGKIAGHLSHLLGKEFYKKRKLPTSVKMYSKDLKHEIEYALRKTVMQMHSCGDSHILQVGHSLMGKEEILENILAACSYLSKNYPGGWANVRSVRIKTSTSLGLPIYTTLKNKNLVQVPVQQPKRPKAYCEVSGELNTAPGIDTVTLTPEGNITVTRRKKNIITE